MNGSLVLGLVIILPVGFYVGWQIANWLRYRGYVK